MNIKKSDSEGFGKKELKFVDSLDKVFRQINGALCPLLELIAVIMVGIAILGALIHVIPHYLEIFTGPFGTEELMHFLEGVLTIVIGIEFMQMLCNPSTENVIEIVTFLVARHMIVHQTSPIEDLFSTLSIALMVFMKWFIRYRKRRAELEDREFEARIRNMQLDADEKELDLEAQESEMKEV